MQLPNRPHQVLLILSITLAAIVVMSWRAPVQAQEPTEEQLELGARIYAENCAVCHGPNGEGRVGATLAQDWPSIRPDLRVRTAIEEGVANSQMPAWSQENGGPLTNEEIEALTLYILSWQTGGVPDLSPTPTFTPRPPITPIPEVEGDPNRGAVLYAENCAVCHGTDGEGRVGATLAQDWPSIRPDLRVKTVIERGVPGSPMSAWSVDNGGPLPDAEINDIVAYILSWQAPAQSVELTPVSAEPQAPSAFSGPLGAVIVLVGLLVLVGIGIAGALRRQRGRAS